MVPFKIGESPFGSKKHLNAWVFFSLFNYAYPKIKIVPLGYEHDSADEQGSGAGGAHALQCRPRQTCGGRANKRQGQSIDRTSNKY